MRAFISHLDELLYLLSVKTKLAIDVQGLKDMSEKVGLKEKYLYEYIYRKKEKARKAGEAEISVQSSRLDLMVQYLGFQHYAAFVRSLEQPTDPVLQGLIGNYYSYVRRNDDKGYLLRSPVRVFQDDHQLVFELHGPSWIYRGELKLVQGCVFVLLVAAGGGKMIHHVYRIGNREKPDVLQGIFSGVSTSFEPIGGRTVLVRVAEEFSLLTNAEATVEAFKSSAFDFEQAVAHYLKDYAANNLRIQRVTTYRTDDLTNRW